MIIEIYLSRILSLILLKATQRLPGRPVRSSNSQKLQYQKQRLLRKTSPKTLRRVYNLTHKLSIDPKNIKRGEEKRIKLAIQLRISCLTLRQLIWNTCRNMWEKTYFHLLIWLRQSNKKMVSVWKTMRVFIGFLNLMKLLRRCSAVRFFTETCWFLEAPSKLRWSTKRKSMSLKRPFEPRFSTKLTEDPRVRNV